MSENYIIDSKNLSGTDYKCTPVVRMHKPIQFAYQDNAYTSVVIGTEIQAGERPFCFGQKKTGSIFYGRAGAGSFINDNYDGGNFHGVYVFACNVDNCVTEHTIEDLTALQTYTWTTDTGYIISYTVGTNASGWIAVLMNANNPNNTSSLDEHNSPNLDTINLKNINDWLKPAY
tara:strand:- start:8 stop:529 length:522 start_codon:yes stop_codon:yes gene_type:complete